MDDNQGAESAPKNFSYTVTSFLERVGISIESGVIKKIDAHVRIEGTVAGKVRRSAGNDFFDLKSGTEKIQVKCPHAYGVSPGENIIVEGTVTVKASSFHAGLEVLLSGKPVGQWQPRETSEPVPEIHKAAYLRLEDFLNGGDLSSFLLLGTEKTMGDVLSCIDLSLRKEITQRTVRTNSRENLIKDLSRQLESAPCEAFALVRGGDDDSIDIWDDPSVISHIVSYEKPFYLAIGHAHRMTLANQYADGSFHTPSALGSCLNDSLMRAQYLARLRHANQSLEQKNAALETMVDSAPSQRAPYVEWVVIALLVGVLWVTK